MYSSVPSRPAPLKGCGEFVGFASAADLKTVIGVWGSWMNSGFGVIEFDVPWSSLLESLGSFWRTLNWLWMSSCFFEDPLLHFARIWDVWVAHWMSQLQPRCPLRAHWVHFSLILIDFHRCSWIFIDFYWFSYNFIDFYWFSLIFIDFHWFS